MRPIEWSKAAQTTVRKIPVSLAATRPGATPMIIKQAMSARCLASFTRKAALTHAETWNGLMPEDLLRCRSTILASLQWIARPADYAIDSK